MKNLKLVSTTSITENYSEEFLPFFLGNTPEEAETNYWKFAKLLDRIATSYHKTSGLDKGDLFGSAVMALARALRDYNDSKGLNLTTYVVYRVKNALNTYCYKNKAIVAVPHYVIQAYKHIDKLRTIILLETEDDEIYRQVLSGSLSLDDIEISNASRQHCSTILQTLRLLAKNNKIKYANLIKYAEYIPLSVSLREEYFDEQEFDENEERQLNAAALVSRLREKMTPLEKEIAAGILAGKTYAEIGAEQNPPRSAAWVRKRLSRLRNRLIDGDEEYDI